MKINDIFESTVAGSIASVSKPLGEIETRVEKPPKGPAVKKNKKKYANQISEGAMKALAYNLKHMDADEFKKVYNKTKDFFQKTDKPAEIPKSAPASTKTGSKAWHDTGYTDKNAAKQIDEPIQEDELKEDDLIIVPGMRRMKDTSFIPHKADRRDHEVEMARSELFAAAKDAQRIYKMIQNRSEDEGLMGWQQSYITLAADYLNSVADSLEHRAATEGAGVIAGGMSNFEESTQKVDPLVTDALKIMKSPEMQDAVKALKTVLGHREYNSRPRFYQFYVQQLMDMYDKQDINEISDFKRKELERELAHEKNNYAVAIDGKVWKVFADERQANNIARSLQRKGKKATVHLTGANVSEAKQHKCPKCGGEMVSEELMNEKKDACYYKVKSRYKVWPSAYASGALVKCRKKGANNWGKSKK